MIAWLGPLVCMYVCMYVYITSAEEQSRGKWQKAQGKVGFKKLTKKIFSFCFIPDMKGVTIIQYPVLWLSPKQVPTESRRDA